MLVAATALGALSSVANTQASTITNTATTHQKHGTHAVKSNFETPASHALGNNSTKTAGLSNDFLATMNSLKAG
jgi:hypothetical protein